MGATGARGVYVHQRYFGGLVPGDHDPLQADAVFERGAGRFVERDAFQKAVEAVHVRADPADAEFRVGEAAARGAVLLDAFDALEAALSAVGALVVAHVVYLEPVGLHEVEADGAELAVDLETQFVANAGGVGCFECPGPAFCGGAA